MTDLSRLRIDRGPEPAEKVSSSSRGSRAAAIYYALGAIVILGGGFFLYRTLSEPQFRVQTSVVTALRTSGSSPSILTASGYIVAQRKASIASKATGRIIDLRYKEGDVVTAGDIIARIESEDVRAALAQAEAELAVARADAFEAERSFERAKSLFNDKLISQSEFDVADSRSQRARATVASKQAAMKASEVAVENTNIRAPFDGTILTKNADIGEVVAPFAAGASSRVAVVTLADMASLQVEVDVSESKIENVSIGQKVDITLDAYPERSYPGIVDKIVPTADRAKATVLTKIRFIDRDERVLPEMSAKAHFLAPDASAANAPPQDVVQVDRRAIFTSGDGEAVYVAAEGRAALRSVQTVPGIGQTVSVVSGLSAGEVVVLSPPKEMADGAALQLDQ